MTAIVDVPVDEPLCQGDILYWEKASNPFERSGIIITADCDLARSKHWGRISVVPLMTMNEYLEELLAPKILRSYEDKLTNNLLLALGNELQVDSPTESSILSLILSDSLPDTLSHNKDIVLSVSALRHIKSIESKVTNVDLLKKVVAHFEKKKDAFQKKVKEYMTFPGDIFYLRELEGIPGNPSVAWLRSLREIPADKIVTRISQAGKDSAFRIGRLKEVFKYRLTQLLAHVFSDIGLPDEHDKGAKQDLADFIQRI